MNCIYAVLLSGGIGSRMASEIPKQFTKLRGESLLRHSVRRFQNWGFLKSLVVVSHKDWILETERELSDLLNDDDRLVEGGDTRHSSVLLGLASLPWDKEDLVFFHDIARPFFRSRELHQLVESTRIHGAASLVSSITDSLVQTSGATFVSFSSLPRETVFSVKTPQMASGMLLKELLSQKLQDRIPTDLCSWVHPKPVGLVQTDSQNIKLTVPWDVSLAELILDTYRE